MGNESQVTDHDLARIAKEAFLKNGEPLDSEKAELYNLEAEFSKTRHNRNPLSFLVVAGFIVVSIGLAVFITLFVQNQNRKIAVDIGDFQNINLRDLLSTARKSQDDLNKAQQTLQDTRDELAAKALALRNDTAGKISVVDAKGLPQADHDTEVAALQAQQASGLAALNAKYAPILKAQQADVNAAQKKIDEYDQKQLDTAKKQAEILNNQQKLHELQLTQTKSYYEAKLKEQSVQYQQDIADLKTAQQNVVTALTLKYNPVFEAGALTTIISAPMDAGLSTDLPGLAAQLTGGKYVETGVFASMQDTLKKRNTLYARLAKIPYQNSVPAALAHLDYLDRSQMGAYEGVAQKLLAIIHRYEARIAVLQAVSVRDQIAFQSYLQQVRENGIVLDARDVNRIAVAVDPSHPIKDGDRGLVFRAADEYVGTVVFSVTSGAITAKQLEVAPDKKIGPFDRFMIKKM